jgi:hypothetical protein
MHRMKMPRRLMISGSAAAALFVVAGLSASAQTTTTTTTTSAPAGQPGGVLITAPGKPTSATPQMVQEACQRQKARTAKFVQFGIPEQFGSEEPFTFDPKNPCS